MLNQICTRLAHLVLFIVVCWLLIPSICWISRIGCHTCFYTQQKNLADMPLAESARKRAAVARQAQGVNTTSSTDTETSIPKYHRASERRVIYGQPDAPAPSNELGGSSSAGGRRRHAEGPSPPPKIPTPPPVLNPGEDENNVGNKLLKKMGWSAGTGLGLSGEGRVDPVQTAIYSAGVGIGAGKARPIEQSMDYASIVKETARQRFENA